MKKLIFSLSMVMLVSTMATFSQMSNTEIHRVISRSIDLNKAVTSNPDSIWPGQRLRFIFEDGFERDWIVSKGETETFIVNQISEMEKIHGNVVAPDTTAVDTAVVKPEASKETLFTQKEFSWIWLWVLVGIAIFVFIVYLLTLLEKKFNKKIEKKNNSKINVDPTKEGKPFVATGVNPENAESHFRALAARNTDQYNIVIRGIRPVFISTKAGLPQKVDFVDGTSEDLSFRNFPGFAGLVSRNKGKTFKEEYFLQGCGNPVYSKRSFKGNGLIISDSPIQFGDEEVIIEETKTSTSEEVKVAETVEETKTSTSEEAASELQVSDVRGISSEHTLLAENFLKMQNAFEVVMEVITNEATVRTTLRTMRAPIEKAKKEEEK